MWVDGMGPQPWLEISYTCEQYFWSETRLRDPWQTNILGTILGSTHHCSHITVIVLLQNVCYTMQSVSMHRMIVMHTLCLLYIEKTLHVLSIITNFKNDFAYNFNFFFFLIWFS